MGIKKKYFGIDLIKVFAVISVSFIHAYLFSGFYEKNIYGGYDFILIFIRQFVFCCVPLFIIITGYLKLNSELNKEYYKKIIPVLTSYLCISVITIFFRKLYFSKTDSIVNLILGVFNFSTIGTAWYVEMYIGLFLLIPFLNILYKNIKTKKKKQILLLTLFCIISIPSTMSYLKIDNISLDIFPNWYRDFYPILYYYIGCYIKEYKIEFNKIINLISLIVFVFVVTFISYFYYHNVSMFSKNVMGYEAIQTVIISTLIFLLLYNLNINGKNIKSFCRKVSSLSLNIYLFSYIFESFYYNYFSKILNGNLKTFIALIVFAPIIFFSSLLSSIILDKIILIFTKIIRSIIKRHKEKYNRKEKCC